MKPLLNPHRGRSPLHAKLKLDAVIDLRTFGVFLRSLNVLTLPTRFKPLDLLLPSAGDMANHTPQ